MKNSLRRTAPQTKIVLCTISKLSTLFRKIIYFKLLIKGALDNFSLIPNFFSKKLRFLYHCVEWDWSGTLLHPFYRSTLFIKNVKMTHFLPLHPLYPINLILYPFYKKVSKLTKCAPRVKYLHSVTLPLQYHEVHGWIWKFFHRRLSPSQALVFVLINVHTRIFKCAFKRTQKRLKSRWNVRPEWNICVW